MPESKPCLLKVTSRPASVPESAPMISQTMILPIVMVWMVLSWKCVSALIPPMSEVSPVYASANLAMASTRRGNPHAPRHTAWSLRELMPIDLNCATMIESKCTPLARLALEAHVFGTWNVEITQRSICLPIRIIFRP